MDLLRFCHNDTDITAVSCLRALIAGAKCLVLCKYVLCQRIVEPLGTTMVFTSCHVHMPGGGCFLNANLPLFFELAVEETYPEITGSTSTYVLTLGNTFVQSLFLAISFVPGASQDSSTWM